MGLYIILWTLISLSNVMIVALSPQNHALERSIAETLIREPTVWVDNSMIDKKKQTSNEKNIAFENIICYSPYVR